MHTNDPNSSLLGTQFDSTGTLLDFYEAGDVGHLFLGYVDILDCSDGSKQRELEIDI